METSSEAEGPTRYSEQEEDCCKATYRDHADWSWYCTLDIGPRGRPQGIRICRQPLSRLAEIPEHRTQARRGREAMIEQLDEAQK